MKTRTMRTTVGAAALAVWMVAAAGGLLGAGEKADEAVPVAEAPHAQATLSAQAREAIQQRLPQGEVVLVQALAANEAGALREVFVKTGSGLARVVLDETDAVVRLAEPMATQDLPQPVAQAADALDRRGTVVRTWKITRGEHTLYELELLERVQVSPNGRIHDREGRERGGRKRQEVAMEDTPTAVQDVVKNRWPDAELREARMQRHGDRTAYHLELQTPAGATEVKTDAEGNVLEVEEELAADALPEAVTQALVAKLGDAKIQDCMKKTEEDKTLFEIEAETNEGKVKAWVTPAGEILRTRQGRGGPPHRRARGGPDRGQDREPAAQPADVF